MSREGEVHELGDAVEEALIQLEEAERALQRALGLAVAVGDTAAEDLRPLVLELRKLGDRLAQARQ
jgi:hypothetical protein